jgi:hypothetical protein
MIHNNEQTIPQIADMLRTKGVQQPKPIHLRNLDIWTANPANAEYYDGWRREAKENAYNGINCVKNSKKTLLMEKYYPKKSNTSAQQPLQTSSSYNQAVFDKYSLRGSGNITESVKLSDADYEDYRLKLMNKRADDYESQQSNVPVQRPPTQAPSNYDADKTMNDLILTSIEERIGNGIIDYGVYNDLLKVIQFYNTYISVFDNVDSLVSIIRRLQELETNAFSIYTNKEQEQESGRDSKDTDYVESFIESLKRLVKYIEINIPVVGQNESIRQQRAKATTKELTSKGRSGVYARLPLESNQPVEEIDPFQHLVDEDQGVAPQAPPRPVISKQNLAELIETATAMGIQLTPTSTKNQIKALIYANQ